MEITPAILTTIFGYVKEGGLAFALCLITTLYVYELKRSAAKDKQNAELQGKIFDALTEMKVAVSNGNLLIEMLTRGRR